MCRLLKPWTWRAPSGAPTWLRRLFPGVWTQREFDDVDRRAHARWLSMQEFIEPDE